VTSPLAGVHDDFNIPLYASRWARQLQQAAGGPGAVCMLAPFLGAAAQPAACPVRSRAVESFQPCMDS
jgi:hypothetical protein